MSLTPRQIRAARALLNWSGPEFAQRTGIHIQTIHHIENGKTKPRDESLQRIETVLTQAGVEFTANEGVRIKPADIDIFEGQERFEDFNDFFYREVRNHGGDICLSVTDERFFAKYMKHTIAHYERMQKLYDEGVFKTFRILANKSNFATKYNYNTYKWQRESSLGPTAFYTFGDYLALISFVHVNPPYVVAMRSAPLAHAYTLAFDAAWASAEPPPRARKSEQ